MNRRELERLGRELGGFLESITEEMGRPERRAAMRAYVTGLLLDGDRKSAEPMAARLVDSVKEVESMRQRLLGCVSDSNWSNAEMLRRLALMLERELPGVEALVIDDTGFPKKGVHSVGVARQYSGTLGRGR
jgi:SRSO17 transposase